MSLKLIVEGGGDRKSKSLNRECRRAFAEFLGKAGLAGRLPSIEAAGGRQQAYDAFKTAHARGSRTAVLLVDAEAPVTAPDPWTQLQTRDGWTRPTGTTNDQCHLMVQVMESWFLADHQQLQAFYGQRFRPRALPGNPNIEAIPKQDVLNGLQRATQDTRRRPLQQGRPQLRHPGHSEARESHSRIPPRREIHSGSPRSRMSRCPLPRPRPIFRRGGV